MESVGVFIQYIHGPLFILCFFPVARASGQMPAVDDSMTRSTNHPRRVTAGPSATAETRPRASRKREYAYALHVQ